MEYFKPKHLFVAGPSRSGTTLLELVLSSHPEITITPETYFIQTAFVKKLPQDQLLPKKELQWLLDQMNTDKKLSSWPNFCIQSFIEKLPKEKPMKLSELLDRLFIEFAMSKGGGITYIGNKRGIYATHGIYTKQLFPNAKFIYIFRDPRDAIMSMIKNIKKHTLYTAIHEYRKIFQGAIKMKTLYPEKVFILKYENLVENPKKICEELCLFLNLKFDERMLHFYEFNKDGKALLGITKNIHQNTLKPFDPSLITKWKKINVDKKILRFIEICTIDVLRYFSYEINIRTNFLEKNFILLLFYSKIFPLKIKSIIRKIFSIVK